MTLKSIVFKDFITLQRGFDLTKTEMSEGVYPVIGSTSIIGYHSSYKVEPPGVITGRSGSLGVVQFIKYKYWPHNTSLWVRDFKCNIPKYVYYFLKTLNLARFNAGAGVPTLNRNHLDELFIQIHPVLEQKKVASILSAYDDLIENNSHRIQILEEMARMIYQEWFVKFRFPGYEQAKFVESLLGTIPQGWEVVSFTSIADVLSGGTPKTTETTFWNGKIPFFTPTDSKNNFYILATEKCITNLGLSKCNSKLYPKDTVFITARGTVGKVIMSAVSMAMNQSCYALVGKSGITQQFLFLLVTNSIDYLKKNTGGATFETIVVDTFHRFSIVKPLEPLIKSFTEVVKPLFDGILNLLRRNAVLQQTRDLLLPKLISGEIDVSEIELANNL